MFKGSKILIVDDSNFNTVLLKEVLLKNGYIPYVANNGPEGLHNRQGRY